MDLTYFDTKNISHLIEECFLLTFSKETVPFKSTIIPNATTNITYIFSENQKAIANSIEMPLEGLIVTGQFFRSYQFVVNSEGRSFGIGFHPTALYKLLNIDVSKLTNKHIPLKEINQTLYNQIRILFLNFEKDIETLISELNKLIVSMPLKVNETTKHIDSTIDLIRKKEGMLSIDEILKKIPFSQKTLENHFKKIVGLTPGKYIRLFRFLGLMRKYESHEIDLKDLIYMYDYYDHSHFSKDFALFMKESPKSYFKKDYPLLREVLKK